MHGTHSNWWKGVSRCTDSSPPSKLPWSKYHLIQGVGEPRHELGLHELGLASLKLALLLDCEGGGLQAEFGDLVVSGLQVLQVRRAALQDRASVCNAAALDLQVGQALELIVCQCLGALLPAKVEPSDPDTNQQH